MRRFSIAKKIFQTNSFSTESETTKLPIEKLILFSAAIFITAGTGTAMYFLFRLVEHLDARYANYLHTARRKERLKEEKVFFEKAKEALSGNKLEAQEESYKMLTKHRGFLSDEGYVLKARLLNRLSGVPEGKMYHRPYDSRSETMLKMAALARECREKIKEKRPSI